MPPVWTREQADKLLAAGLISQDRYNADQGVVVLPTVEVPPTYSVPYSDDINKNFSRAGLSLPSAPTEPPALTLPEQKIGPGGAVMADTQTIGPGGAVMASPQVIADNRPRNLLAELEAAKQSNRIAKDIGLAPVSFDDTGITTKIPEATELPGASKPEIQVGPVKPLNAPGKSAGGASGGSKPGSGVVGYGWGDPLYKPPTELEKRIAKAQEERSDLTNAEKKAAEAEEEAKKTGIKKALEEESYIATKTAMQQKQAADFETAEAERQKQLNDRMTDVNKSVDALSKMRVNGDRFWHNKSTGEHIGLALSIGLGAFGASLTRGPNYAYGIVKDAIENDIREQEFNIQSKRGEVDTKRGLLGDLMKLTGDQRSAQLLAQKKALDTVETEAERIAAKYNTEQARQNLEAFKALVNVKREELNYNINQNEKNKLLREQAATAAELRRRIDKMDDRGFKLDEERRTIYQNVIKEGATPEEALAIAEGAFSGRIDPVVGTKRVTEDKESRKNIVEQTAALKEKLKALDENWQRARDNRPMDIERTGVYDLAARAAGSDKLMNYNSAIGNIRALYNLPGLHSVDDRKAVIDQMIPKPGQSDESVALAYKSARQQLFAEYPLGAKAQRVIDEERETKAAQVEKFKKTRLK